VKIDLTQDRVEDLPVTISNNGLKTFMINAMDFEEFDDEATEPKGIMDYAIIAMDIKDSVSS